MVTPTTPGNNSLYGLQFWCYTQGKRLNRLLIPQIHIRSGNLAGKIIQNEGKCNDIMTEDTAGLIKTGSMDSLEYERQLRRRLGIPDWAERVMVVAESTHWDPDWVLTSREYYRYMVRKALERAINELTIEPRRVFDVECVFFLRKYFERSPHRRQTVVDLVNNGQLRFTGSGITTPDTLLPSEEALIRDLLTGQQWMRDNSMVAEPHTLYLPDSFGHTPGLPSIATSCGIDGVAFTRIDGMYFIGIEYTPKSHYPRIQSSAERLMDARALDFFWTDSNGSRVLAHWNAFNYGHGDMLAGRGISRSLAMYQGIPDRSDSNVASKIEKFADQLDRFSPTPYLLLAMGLDFTVPLKGLVSLLDRYNERHSRKTGIFVVNAGLDDYFNLVRCHADSLEEFDLDSNPYFMGFYSSRLPLKKAHKKITDQLIAAETASVALGDSKLQSDIFNADSMAWQIATVGNHHDFITGTGSDRVYNIEQWPWFMHALGIAHTSLLHTIDSVDGTVETPQLPKRENSDLPVSYRHNGDIIAVESSYLDIEIDLSSGGKIRKCVSKTDGRTLLSPCGELISALDRGGMWRMGNEFAGGKLDEVASTDGTAALASIRENHGGIEITITVELEGRPVMQSIWVAPDSPFIAIHTELNPRFHRSVLLRLALPEESLSQTPAPSKPLDMYSRELSRIPFHSGPRYNEDMMPDDNSIRIVMSQPGAPVSRPVRRHFLPTIWPLNGWAYVEDQKMNHMASCLAISSYCSTGISADTDGNIIIVAGRNPGKERALGFVPFLGFPAKYHEKERCVLDVGLYFPSEQDYLREYPTIETDPIKADPRKGSEMGDPRMDTVTVRAIPIGAIRLGEMVQDKLLAHVEPSVHSLMKTASGMLESPGFSLMAAKPASNGNGLIFRLRSKATGQNIADSTAMPGTLAIQNSVTLRNIRPVQAYLCDAMERDITELPISGHSIQLEPEHQRGAFITMRILTDQVPVP